MAAPHVPAAHPLNPPQFSILPLDITVYHGTAYAIATLEPAEAGLLENAPPAAYLTHDLPTAEAYARRTASRLLQNTGRRLPPLTYAVRLTEPRTADCAALINQDATFAPAYRQSSTTSGHDAWDRCLAHLEQTLQLAVRTAHGAAVILTPAGPDGDLTRVPNTSPSSPPGTPASPPSGSWTFPAPLDPAPRHQNRASRNSQQERHPTQYDNRHHYRSRHHPRPRPERPLFHDHEPAVGL